MSTCRSPPVHSILLPSIRSNMQPCTASPWCCPKMVSAPITRISSREQPPSQKLSSKGQRDAGEQCRGIAGGNQNLLGHGLKQKDNKACLGRKPHIFLNLGSFQSESPAARQLARPRPQPGRQKFIGLERFQTKHCWLSEAGLFSAAVSNQLQR